MKHQKILGYSKEELSKNKLWGIGIVRDDKDFKEALLRLARDGVIYFENIAVKNKAGLSVNTEVILVDKEKVIQCNIRDNTERKQTEGEMRKRLQELEVFYEASVGREERILELKKQVAELEEKLKGA